MNLWRGRQYFVAYWRGISKQVRGIFRVYAWVFTLPLLVALIGIFSGEIIFLLILIGIMFIPLLIVGLIILPYSILSAISFAYLANKHEWKMAEAEFSSFAKNRLKIVNAMTNLGTLGLAMLPFNYVNPFAILANRFSSGIPVFLLSVMIWGAIIFGFGWIMASYASNTVDEVLSLEKPKRKQKNQLEDELDIGESIEDDSLEEVMEKEAQV